MQSLSNIYTVQNKTLSYRITLQSQKMWHIPKRKQSTDASPEMLKLSEKGIKESTVTVLFQENGKHIRKERQEKQKQKSQLKNKTRIKEPDGNVRGEK